MNAKHTPGPWELRQSTRDYWFIDYEQGGEDYTLTKLECGERDARLISAAPELFAALEQAYYSLKLAAVRLELDESTEFYKDIDAAYRALQKAKGEPA
jgi:hypothetical protein